MHMQRYRPGFPIVSPQFYGLAEYRDAASCDQQAEALCSDRQAVISVWLAPSVLLISSSVLLLSKSRVLRMIRGRNIAYVH
ncbi:hypothetical protein CCHOA_04780 [Corynebacterium choanae]|uniref:Uncharacterized protein n=1 Tax=Corynebacterium choanae TaxID=1862358 RepID=A0A3G6JB97_9CORY|nr:hypothetical protein CCHOA_04780 [Corynebacterium choanae]